MSLCKKVNNSSVSLLKTTKITTLFFDLDNTLISTRKGDSKACRKLSEQLENIHGFSNEEADSATRTFLQSFRSCPDNPQTSLDSWRSYLWSQALPDRYKHLNEQIYRHWLQLRYRYLALSPEYENLLRKFRSSGYRLALITNGPSNGQWEKIKKVNVGPFFDCVLVSSDLPWEKPHPNIFLAACDFLNVKPAECAMIGDKIETDIQGGKAAKLGATIWIPLNADKLQQFEEDSASCDSSSRPDLIVQNLCELLKYFPYRAGGGGSESGGASSGSQRRNSTMNPIAASSARRNLHQNKRGFSLPQIDYNSENSSDSLFSNCS